MTPESFDKLKCLEMALVHDFAEIYAGDYTPDDAMTSAEKHQIEMKAMEKISSELSKPYLLELFFEFESQQTKEAKFVKALDKLDTVLTACYYDENKRALEKLLPEFGAYAQKCLQKEDFEGVFLVKDMLNQILEKNN